MKKKSDTQKIQLFNSLLKHIYVEFNCCLTNELMDFMKVDMFEIVWEISL